ncbi:MAG TPA: N-methyl-L-tryptophan oxidase [Polyangiaceae bacterium]|nr:N-methyl-L-tryptophan oxidase [Polyangiaceae bacterium]
MTGRYDLAVLGLGGFGSAILAHAAARGLRAVGIERHVLGHELASSSSSSRGFRKAYFSHPSYVALAHQAERHWRALETEVGEPLYEPCGALFVGPADHPGVLGVTESARTHGLPHEVLSAAELATRYPALRPAAGSVGVLELDAGVLHADRCNAAHVARARAAGAEIREREAALDVRVDGDGVTVVTAQGEIHASHVVLATGAWLSELPTSLLSGLSLPFRIERQVELWFTPDGSGFDSTELPLFHFGTTDRARTYYGIPRLGGGPLKAVRHYGGRTVAPDDARSVSAEDEADVRGFLREFLPRADGPRHSAKVCLNVNTPDMHLVLGRHPREPRVLLAGGCSGHGYKFSPVVGEAVVDLVTRGATDLPISAFDPGRFRTTA